MGIDDFLIQLVKYWNREKRSPEKLNTLMKEFELEKDTLDKNFENLSGGKSKE